MQHIQLDHIIVHVNNVEQTVAFWTDVMGVKSDGASGPFTILRITPELTFQLAPWGTQGGSHYAFALPNREFDAVFSIIKSKNIPYGDSYHTVGEQTGPGEEDGAKGLGKTIYFFDPNKHLLEIRTYEL